MCVEKRGNVMVVKFDRFLIVFYVTFQHDFANASNRPNVTLFPGNWKKRKMPQSNIYKRQLIVSNRFISVQAVSESERKRNEKQSQCTCGLQTSFVTLLSGRKPKQCCTKLFDQQKGIGSSSNKFYVFLCKLKTVFHAFVCAIFDWANVREKIYKQVSVKWLI